ncbi:MAG: winged helix-turn-helix domain-containing protein [Burkholderiales bacterium]
MPGFRCDFLAGRGGYNDRSIDVQILRLRRKIEANPSAPQFIKTAHGAGYIFSVPVEVLY